MVTSITVHERASYLRDAVFAAQDGLITTFAIVAGSTGAGFSTNIALILGFANLFADGFSMASGTYVGVKSEAEYEKAKGVAHWKSDAPFKQAMITFISFVMVGLLPLTPYILKVGPKFETSVVVVAASLFLIGTLKGIYGRRNWLKSGFEVLLIGSVAAILAYSVGVFVNGLV